jgi:hypothetical protein
MHGIYCMSDKYAVLKSKSKDWLDRNRDNVSELIYMSTGGLLFQWSSTIKNLIKHAGLVQREHLIEMCFSLAMIWLKIAHLELNSNHSLGHMAFGYQVLSVHG